MRAGAPKEDKVYFGWWIVIVGFLLMALVYAAHGNLSGLFVKPMADGFGVPRTAVALTMSITSLAGVVASLLAGKLFNRFQLRRVVVFSLCMMAVGYAIIYFAPSIFFVYIGVAVRGGFFTFSVVLPLSLLINDWFGKRIRGRVWGLVMMGSGVGGAVLSPIAGTIIENWGWRNGFLFCGVLLLPMIPLVALTFVRTPEEKGLKRIGDDPDDRSVVEADKDGIPADRAVRTGMFWLLMLGIMLICGTTQVWTVNGLSYLNDNGFNMVQVSIVNAVQSVGLTVGKVAIGAVCDKKSTLAGTLVCVVLLVVAFVLYCFVGGAVALGYLIAVIMGAGHAAVNVPPQLLTRDLLGRAGYVTLAGYTQGSIGLGSFVLPLIAASAFDVTGSYIPAWVGSAVLAVVGFGLVWAAFRMKPALMARLAAIRPAGGAAPEKAGETAR